MFMFVVHSAIASTHWRGHEHHLPDSEVEFQGKHVRYSIHFTVEYVESRNM